ncbi:inverse autotransporter beta domain-containing protein [Gilliamella apis]|uniref:inverse autotransporter beta domain-containing protein n=1 Tax=Gilliamella apis TaxID=1970738 RepID=UPI00080D8F21|nr:inverse autotransporter beta domain-containing protein [Gilliamella apis]OCG02504.1 hypothetical protein A9G19_06145 [Gilliamella apis]
MTKSLNLKIISAFVIATLSLQPVYATDSETSSNAVDSNKIIELKNGTKAREMINNQQRSLYQIALLSSISISELRAMNAGRFDKKDVVDIGERLVLPENSPLLPAIKINDDKKDKYSNLPKLSSDDNYDVKQDKDALATQVASTLQTLATQDWKQITSSDNGGISGHLKDKGKDYAENYVRNGVKTQIVDPVRNAAQDFLGRFGTAQLQFDLSDKGQFNNVNLKLFSPWIDTEDMLIFSQITFQEYEHNRRIGNIGIGQRWDVADKKWLLGYNVFLDHDFQRAHNRLGIGAEAWSDYMKFAVNYYHPLSDWKESQDFDEYLERAAKGFDIRFQGYLPQYPHLGGSLMYEQYFGDKVALFGKDNLQKDPRAITVGLDYTPVPLFTIKAQHKRGQDNKKTTTAELTMNYRIGTPLKDQLDPDMVQSARSLKGSRYDLVDRNNYIVLEYKEKKMTVDLGLESIQIIEGTTSNIFIALHNAKGVSKLVWSGNMQDIDDGGGFLCSAIGTCTASSWFNPPASVDNWKIVAPKYLDKNGQRHPVSTNGIYSLSVTVTDGKGKRSATSNSVSFEVLPNNELRRVGVWAIDVYGRPSAAPVHNPANGTDTVTLMATLVTPKEGVETRGLTDYDGFSDDILMDSIENSFEASVTDLWVATSNGNPINLIDGTTGNITACPTADPCVIVKSFEKIKMGHKISNRDIEVIGDTYAINVASNITGTVDFVAKLNQYGQSLNHAIVYFNGGQAGRLEVYRSSDNALVAKTDDNPYLVFNPSGPNEWKVHNEYYVVAYDLADNVIQDPFIVWSLVGSNDSACPGNRAVNLKNALGDPNYRNGPWFNVSMGKNARYKIRGIKSTVNGSNIDGEDSYAFIGTSIEKVEGAPEHVNWQQVSISERACAGDQGFLLQVIAY